MNKSKVFIIAEAGVNHNKDLVLAKELVAAAVASGADAVKFQTFMPDSLATPQAAKAAYQKKNTGSSAGQLEMLRDLQLPLDWHYELKQLCDNQDIQFLSTPFDSDSLNFLVNELNLEKIKLGSGELTNGPLLFDAARTGKELIVSTGMSSIEEIEQAIGLIGCASNTGFNFDATVTSTLFKELSTTNEVIEIVKNKVSLLHCTSEYPADYKDVNLNAMKTMRDKFGLPVGYSDHTLGIHVPVAAAALGASVIEKHFTLNKRMAGPDHIASIEPQELEAMVRQIREIEYCLGTGVKLATEKEANNKTIVRKVLVAATSIIKGEMFTKDNILAKRSGNGLSPMEYWSLIGKVASRDYEKNEIIE